jgi:2-keto-3-deoxy-L-rhamnonate aldolase RhmA
MIQLETPAAIAKLEEIAAVDGVDALFMGPGDLSASMGVIGNVADAKVQAALKDAAARAKAVGKPIGIVGPTPEMVGQFIDWGYSYVAIASDMGMMMRQANAMITALKPSLAKAVNSSVY